MKVLRESWYSYPGHVLPNPLTLVELEAYNSLNVEGVGVDFLSNTILDNHAVHIGQHVVDQASLLFFCEFHIQ